MTKLTFEEKQIMALNFPLYNNCVAYARENNLNLKDVCLDAMTPEEFFEHPPVGEFEECGMEYIYNDIPLF